MDVDVKTKLHLAGSVIADMARRMQIVDKINELQKDSLTNLVLIAAGDGGVITFNEETGFPSYYPEGVRDENYADSIVGIRYKWDEKQKKGTIEINIDVDEDSDTGVDEEAWFDPYADGNINVEYTALCIGEWLPKVIV